MLQVLAVLVHSQCLLLECTCTGVFVTFVHMLGAADNVVVHAMPALLEAIQYYCWRA